MNKNDLERMMSLVDDRYVNELFSEKISMPEKHHFLKFAGCAAALIAVIAGINILVDNSSPDISDLNQIRTEITVTESAMPYSGMTGDDENTDYSQYFKSGYLSWSSDYNSSEVGGRTYSIDGEYVKETVPFADFFEEGFGHASIVCDKIGTPVKGYVSYCDLSLHHNIYMTMSSKERIVSDIESEPVKRHGIDIYGYDDYSYMSEPSYLTGRVLYFHVNETDYMIRFSADFDCEEAVKLMDTVIFSGIKPSDFNISNSWAYDSSSGHMSLSGANELEFFKGYVPQVESVDFGNGIECVLNVNYGENYQGDTLASQWLDIDYREYSDNIGDHYERPYIELYYNSDKLYMPLDAIPVDELSRESLGSDQSVFERPDGVKNYYYTIEADAFYIDVSTNVSADILWSVLSDIAP